VSCSKKPKTDNGVKNSARGLIRIEREHGDFVMYDRQTPEQEAKGCLTTVFEDGKVVVEHKIADIRKRLLER
jgi:nicotinamide phosphoribosyltransferase